MSYADLERDFPDRRLTRIVNCTKDNPLTFNQVAVYSCLVERATHGKGASQKQIAKATRLHKSAVTAALMALDQQHRLAKKDREYWKAQEPTGDKTRWFRYRKGTDSQQWYRRFSYWWSGIRTKLSPFTTRQTAVYFKLLNLADAGRKPTRRGLAKLLRVDLKTVRAAITKLTEHGLLEDDLWPLPPSTDQMKWFRKRPTKRQFKLAEEFAINEKYENAESIKKMLNRYGQQLLDAGYSERQIRDYFAHVVQKCKRTDIFDSFLLKFPGLLKTVEERHRANVASGKVTKAKNSRGLLKLESEKAIRLMLVGQKNWGY